MNKKMQAHLVTAAIAAAMAALVVWASNNVDAVEDVIG